MKYLSATCVAIRLAFHEGTLRIVERTGRFGQYFAIEDQFGLIEVARTREEVDARIAGVARDTSPASDTPIQTIGRMTTID